MSTVASLTAQFGLLVVGCPLPPHIPPESPPRKLPIAVPLKKVQVSGSITHPNLARLTLSQTFENENEFPLSAVYKFPLEADAAVCGFQAEIVEQDGKKRVVKGTVKERKMAATQYKEAVGKGQGAYLVESEKDDGESFKPPALAKAKARFSDLLVLLKPSISQYSKSLLATCRPSRQPRSRSPSSRHSLRIFRTPTPSDSTCPPRLGLRLTAPRS